MRAFAQQGTYYSEAGTEGADAAEPQDSQSHLAHVAARAVILIEAGNPAIGLTAFVPAGMSEVSSRMIDQKIRPGYHVAKGEELGYFQFGGSTRSASGRGGCLSVSFRLPSCRVRWVRSLFSCWPAVTATAAPSPGKTTLLRVIPGLQASAPAGWRWPPA